MIVKRAHLNIALYLLASALFFVVVGLPVLRGEIAFQFYMDSLTYHEIAAGMGPSVTAFSIGGNFFGPVLIVRVLGGSFALIYLFNIAVFMTAFLLAARALGADQRTLAALAMLCPMIFTSLLSVNKEILAILGMTLLVVGLERRRAAYYLLALAAATLVRWQQIVVVLAVLAAVSRINPVRRWRLATLAVIVLALSIAYPAQLNTFADLDTIAQLEESRNTSGSGMYNTLLTIQNTYFGYLLVVIPKTLQLYVGHIARWRNITDFSDVANNVVAIFQSAANLLVLSLAAWRRRLKLEHDAVFVAAIYAAIFALTPIFSSRYLFPATWLLCVSIAQGRAERRARAAEPAALEAEPG